MEDKHFQLKSQRLPSRLDDKINNNLVKSQSKAHNSPNFRAKFNYIEPLAASSQQLPYEQQTLNAQKTQQKFKMGSFQSQTYLKLMNAPQIKVNWNAFIKIKTHNYLDDYQIVKKIGRGGFGIVYTAKSLHTEVIRAAKVIKKADLNAQGHLKLLEELNIMRELDHPNIIKLYEVYDFKNQYTLILELCQGGELSSKLRNKKIPELSVKQYMRQILRTLIYLHEQNIVHRDIKPGNMLLEKKGAQTIKIIDFGLAVRLDHNQYLTNRIGTPSYLAPEVIYKKYNQKCDVWAAGVICYMMITGGTSPFKSQNQSEMMQNVLRDQPKFQGSSWKNISTRCIQILKLMFEKKPENRPSAKELIQHSWFTQELRQGSNLQESEKHKFLKNIRIFSFKNKLHAVVNTFIASQLLSASEKTFLTQLFLQIDSNQNGVIEISQLKKAMDQNKFIPYDKLQLLIKIIDTNRSGQIDYTEFLVAAFGYEDFMKKQYFQKAFKYFDINHSGTITYQEVTEFLGNYQQSEDQIKKMFIQVDKNGDGNIQQDQFIQLFINNADQIKSKYFIKQIPDQKSNK